MISIVVDAGGVDFVVAVLLENVEDGFEFWDCVNSGSGLGLRRVLVRCVPAAEDIAKRREEQPIQCRKRRRA